MVFSAVAGLRNIFFLTPQLEQAQADDLWKANRLNILGDPFSLLKNHTVSSYMIDYLRY